MSGRSSACSALVAVAAIASCGHPAAPEADPAQIQALAAKMAGEVPVPASQPHCTPADLAGAPDLTYRTLRQLGNLPIAATAELADWINPVQLDVPAVRVLADPAADTTVKRRAAAEMLGARAWLVHDVQFVGAPLALGVKELKIGTVGTLIIRYDRATGKPTCTQLFSFQNTRATNDWAIKISDTPVIDPRVQKVLRDDLAAQYLKLTPRGQPAG
jgi:hypothetical protein